MNHYSLPSVPRSTVKSFVHAIRVGREAPPHSRRCLQKERKTAWPDVTVTPKPRCAET